MRFLVVLTILITFVSSGMAQNVDLIKNNNLFDENRGYTEVEGEEVDAEKEIKLPANMPVLDGIIIIKNYKKAIFTYYDKEKKKKISRYHSPGDKFGGVTLKEINPEYVTLVFDGKKYKLYPDTKLKAKKSHSGYTPTSRVSYTPPPKRQTASVRSKPAQKKPVFKRPGRIPVNRRLIRGRSGVSTARKARPVRDLSKVKSRRKAPVNSKGVSNPFAGGRVKTPPSKNNKAKRTNTPF